MTEQKYISLALGTFDVFHLGHMAVINAAKQSEYPMYALLFNEHPLKAIVGKAPPELLCDSVLFRLRDEYGIPAIHIDFGEIMDLSAEEFFYDILLDDMSVRELSCGENYSFGKGGKGDVALLCELCKQNDIKLNVVPTVMYKDEPISSTRIRLAIENGNVEDANAMLGRPFSFAQSVIHGESRGHSLGFPTANQLLPESFVKPRRGVYAAMCRIDGKLYPAVTNYGIKPTVGGTKPVSETHIIGLEADLYSSFIEVQLLSFIRDEMKFPDLQRLKGAISEDCKTSLKIFAKHLENGR